MPLPTENKINRYKNWLLYMVVSSLEKNSKPQEYCFVPLRTNPNWYCVFLAHN